MGTLALVFAGLAALVIGSDLAVRGAEGLATRLGIPALVVGLTITSVGTSLPEIGTNLAAAWSGRVGTDASGLAVGNIVGSCFSQITLLLGIAGFVAVLTIPRHALRRDGAAVAGALGMMLLVSVDGLVTRGEGAFLVALYVAYVALVIVQERGRLHPAPPDVEPPRLAVALLLTAVGLAMVLFGASLVVTHGVGLARTAGISESLIGLGVGIATGLPELTISLRAIRSGSGELSLGNLLGSNITDPLLSFGLGAAVTAVHIPRDALRVDFVWWAAGTAVALLLLNNHLDLNRRESSVLLVLFGLFVYLRITA